ncbi:MAG: 50S ribosomal protein L11 [Phycisphaerales bacterium]|nr:MAG: 50S ribosomal protein L11 [Phycisphaerales bacterium]
MVAKKKEVVAVIRLQAPGGQATPAPPIGPALGQHGVNIGQFVQQFNASTNALNGMKVTVVITVFVDKSFTFEVKSPPAAVLLKEAAGIAKAAGTAGKETIATVTSDQVREIAQRKINDLNAGSIDAAVRMVAGTARSMGIEVTG